MLESIGIHRETDFLPTQGAELLGKSECWSRDTAEDQKGDFIMYLLNRSENNFLQEFFFKLYIECEPFTRHAQDAFHKGLATKPGFCQQSYMSFIRSPVRIHYRYWLTKLQVET